MKRIIFISAVLLVYDLFSIAGLPQIQPTPQLNSQRIDSIERDVRDLQSWRYQITDTGTARAIQNSADIEGLKTTVASLDRTMWLIMGTAVVSFVGMLFQLVMMKKKRNGTVQP